MCELAVFMEVFLMMFKAVSWSFDLGLGWLLIGGEFNEYCYVMLCRESMSVSIRYMELILVFREGLLVVDVGSHD
jgi:hypothetical protein